jgi:hypothetical protein
MSHRELSFYTPPSIFNKICACSCTRIHKVLTVIYSFMFKTLQLQRFIKCLIITRYDLKFIGICHQLIVAEWLLLLATNLKVSGSSLTVTPGGWCIKRQLPTTHTRAKTFDKHLMEYMWRTLYSDKNNLFEHFLYDICKVYPLDD